MHGGARALFDDPDLFLFRLDARRARALFVFMRREAYRSSTFLDLRGHRARGGGLAVSLRELFDAAPARQREARFIFHLGHGGSTLLSRSVGELPGAHVLREPPALIDLARWAEVRGVPRRRTIPASRATCDGVFALLAKTYRPGEIAVIKPSSLANGIMPDALCSPRHRALFLYCSLPTFLASMLRSDANRADAVADLASCLRAGRPVVRPAQVRRQPIARKLAALWILHMDRFFRLLPHVPASRLRSLDADDFFASPADTLRHLGRFFGFAWTTAEIAKVVAGPVFRRDAKHPRRRYDARARHAELAAARRTFHAEIEDASTWAARLMRDRPIPSVVPRPLFRSLAV